MKRHLEFADAFFSFVRRQVQGASGGGATYNGVWNSLVRMWKEEGARGYMRGNGVNCLRIVPYVLPIAYPVLEKKNAEPDVFEIDILPFNSQREHT